jgi:hypothetical protein
LSAEPLPKCHRQDNSSSAVQSAGTAATGWSARVRDLVEEGCEQWPDLKQRIGGAKNAWQAISVLFQDLLKKEWALKVVSMTRKGFQDMANRLDTEITMLTTNVSSEAKREMDVKVELEAAKVKESQTRKAHFKATESHREASADLFQLQSSLMETTNALQATWHRLDGLNFLKLMIEVVTSNEGNICQDIELDEFCAHLGVHSEADLLKYDVQTMTRLSVAFKNLGMDGCKMLLKKWAGRRGDPNWAATYGEDLIIQTSKPRTGSNWEKRLQYQ